ncbi:MAG: thiolase [Actinomycetia bacterium]|nr:thiolase [Actinomycetes bacterium]
MAIVGVAESDLGLVAAGMTPVDLMAQAVGRALVDAGLELADVDGLCAAAAQLLMPTAALSAYLGISPRFVDATSVGGASFESHVASAEAAIAAGRCETVVIAYGSTRRSTRGSGGLPSDTDPYEGPYRPVAPFTQYALAASRHMHEFGTTREHLAAVAVSARRWAQLNPKAFNREPLTIDDVLAARMMSYPLTVRDSCLLTDGGGAVVLTSAERARSLRKPPVHVLGTGQAVTHMGIAGMPDLTVTGAAESGRQAYEAAGLGPADVDVVEVYDAFTINTLLFLEDLGFCAKGEAGPLVASGAIDPGGTLPVNTNGGGLSYCHPGMYGIFLLIEAARQVRGEAGDRQVAGAEVALAHGNGGFLSAQSTVILGAASTI